MSPVRADGRLCDHQRRPIHPEGRRHRERLRRLQETLGPKFVESEFDGGKPQTPILFGIFGNTLMPPHIVAKKIINICCSYILINNVDHILSTIDSGFCVFETSTVITYLEKQQF